MDKQVAVITGDQVADVQIQEGTTTADVLTALKLPGNFMLSKRDGLPFGRDEVIWGQIEAGEKIYASAPANVASGIRGQGKPAPRPFLRFIASLFSDNSGKRTSTRARPTVRPATRSEGRGISVERNTRKFFEERGWSRRGDSMHGFYRTRFGSFKGRIDQPSCRKPTFFIIKPPRALLDGPHGACFHERAKDTFWVHFAPAPKDVTTGVMRIEHALLEVLGG